MVSKFKKPSITICCRDYNRIAAIFYKYLWWKKKTRAIWEVKIVHFSKNRVWTEMKHAFHGKPRVTRSEDQRSPLPSAIAVNTPNAVWAVYTHARSLLTPPPEAPSLRELNRLRVLSVYWVSSFFRLHSKTVILAINSLLKLFSYMGTQLRSTRQTLVCRYRIEIVQWVF